jgi:hypothetical protein
MYDSFILANFDISGGIFLNDYLNKLSKNQINEQIFSLFMTIIFCI